MMTPREAMALIESNDFIAQVGIASDLRTLHNSLRQHPAFQYLSQHLGSPAVRKTLFARISQLSTLRIDPRFEHPADTPLTIYLSILIQSDPPLAALAAEIVSQAPQCWWAAKTAIHILLGKQVRNSSAHRHSTVLLEKAEPFSISQQDLSGESLIISSLVAPAVKSEDINLWTTSATKGSKREMLAA